MALSLRSLAQLKVPLLRALVNDQVNELANDLDDSAQEVFGWTMWNANTLDICHVLNQEGCALCLACGEINGLVDFASEYGPPFCSDRCHFVLCTRFDELMMLVPPAAAPAAPATSCGSSLHDDDFDAGDERVVSGPPSKHRKIAPDARLARLLRPDETLSLIGNHPNANGDDFASSQSIRKQLPPILKDAFEFDDAAFGLLMTRTVSYDVNTSGDNTTAHVRYDAACFLLDLFEAPGSTRALGMGCCIDHLEQLRGHYELAVQANRGDLPAASVPYFGDNVNKRVKSDKRPGRYDRVVVDSHMRPETYGGNNLSILEFVSGGPFSKPLKRVPLAIAGHANGVEGGLAKYLRANLVKLLRSLASDDELNAVPSSRVHKIDVSLLKRWIKANKPTTAAIPLKEKQKSEPARKATK